MKRRTKKDRTTKDGRTILSPKSYTALRMLAFDLSGGICECGCGRPAPWPDSGRPPMPWEGALHHLNGRGMGSGKRNDVLSEVAWWREECHHKHHSPKVVPAKGKSMSTHFTDDDIRRTGLPKDVMSLIHDLCYHHDGRDVWDYVRRAQEILKVESE